MPRGATAKKGPKLGAKAKPERNPRNVRAQARTAPLFEPAVQHDLLDEPLLGVESAAGRKGVSLPEVLAGLGENEVRGFTGLQAHQQHAWHAFLVQLAAIALHAAQKSEPRQGAPAWRKLLLALTEGRREPWCLVVGDLSLAAFMQPPVPERTLDGFQDPVVRPDEIDVLVTAKNHDVKAARISSARPEHWAYALVSLQTMEGFSGRNNYGIARMNSGSGSRPGVGLSPGLHLGARFVRDVQVLLGSRDDVLDRIGFADEGKRLLWLEPWDGEKRLAHSWLDPFFIEVCRRMRLVPIDATIGARFRPTSAQRVAADDLKGNTGDAWTPVSKADAKAFTAGDGGFNYRVLQRLLGDEFERGAALVPRRGEPEALLIATVLARGQGKTNGYHARTLPIPAAAMSLLRSADGREKLARLARERVELVGDVRLAVLKPAILVLLQGDPETLNFKDERAQRWLDRLESAIDGVFFERLWGDLERDPDTARGEWALQVLDLARAVLDGAAESSPLPAARRYRCLAAAERRFDGAARKHVKLAFPEPGGPPR